jgi:hypothetical protein
MDDIREGLLAAGQLLRRAKAEQERAYEVAAEWVARAHEAGLPKHVIADLLGYATRQSVYRLLSLRRGGRQ